MGKMKRQMSGMKNMHLFRRAAVLGGGPSLPADLERVPPGAVLIAVNYHALRLCEPHYLVFNDDPGEDERLGAAVAECRALPAKRRPILVSPQAAWSDVEFDVEVWTGHYSSNTAAWLGLWLGCNPVILCGMDCYQGEQKYFYAHEDKAVQHYPLEHHLRPWVEEARNVCPNPTRLRAMSGPLVEVFGEFQANYGVFGRAAG